MVKKMRLAGIKIVDTVNKYIEIKYIPKHNNKTLILGNRAILSNTKISLTNYGQQGDLCKF